MIESVPESLLERRLRERFSGLIRYILETRGSSFKFFRASPTSFLKFHSSSGQTKLRPAQEAAWHVMKECLHELEEYFDRQVEEGRLCDDEFKMTCSKFLVEVAAPLGVRWRKASWLDEWDDALQPDAPKKRSMVDDVLGNIIAYCKLHGSVGTS